MPKSGGASRIVFLDYLRIVSLLLVFIAHKSLYFFQSAAADQNLHTSLRSLSELMVFIVQQGGTGVTIFFLISGYIIAWVLQSEQPVSFLIRRVFRIYPLYVFAVFCQLTVEQQWGSVSLATLVQQLLLIGDFYGTPHTLGGVEWTLRVEMLFYLFMAALKFSGLLDARRHMLIYVLIAMTILMSQLSPFPDGDGLFTRSYFLISFPFCLLGAGFFLYEKNEIGIGLLIALGLIVFANYYFIIGRDQPRLLSARFGEIGVLFFAVAWKFRGGFQAGALVLLLSDLTYSVYLFHNWLFDSLHETIIKISPSTNHSGLIACAGLLTLCYIFNKKVEVPANNFGRTVAYKLNQRRSSQPVISTELSNKHANRKE